MKKTLLIVLILLILPRTVKANDNILSDLTLTADELDLTKGERFNVNINNKVKGSNGIHLTKI